MTLLLIRLTLLLIRFTPLLILIKKFIHFPELDFISSIINCEFFNTKIYIDVINNETLTLKSEFHRILL